MNHLLNRIDTILFHCKDVDVLDIGSTGQTQAYDQWPVVKQVAKSVTGIDIVARDDPAVELGNMETHQFDKSFDVVLAGDVLEHVMNQGLFLENIKKHLKPQGVLILTTPNAKWPTVFLKPNPTHTLWHDRYTLSYLLQQAGYLISFSAYYLGNKHSYPKLLWPLVWRQGLIVVAQKSHI